MSFSDGSYRYKPGRYVLIPKDVIASVRTKVIWVFYDRRILIQRGKQVYHRNYCSSGLFRKLRKQTLSSYFGKVEACLISTKPLLPCRTSASSFVVFENRCYSRTLLRWNFYGHLWFSGE